MIAVMSSLVLATCLAIVSRAIQMARIDKGDSKRDRKSMKGAA